MKEITKKFNLPKYIHGKSFAEASKLIEKKFKGRSDKEAMDTKNASSSYSSTFQFYTEGEGVTNHLPFSPELVNPVLNTAVQEATTTLEWTASDVDGDPLTFDIFFDTVNPPTTKVGDNQSTTTLDVALDPSTNYYWKVVVKDTKDAVILGQTIGQIWNFKTD